MSCVTSALLHSHLSITCIFKYFKCVSFVIASVFLVFLCSQGCLTV